MCTVTLTSRTGGGYLLGGNRDEQKNRERGLPPGISVSKGVRYLAPVDAKAGGTWIAINEAGISLAILNRYSGNKFQPDLPSEPPSRGMIISGLIHYKDMDSIKKELISGFDATQYRPFALIAVSPSGESIRWDWNGEDFKVSNSKFPPSIWVSSGYNQALVTKVREELFDELLSERDLINVDSIKQIHSSEKPEPGPLAISMEFMHVQTVSSTIVEYAKEGIRMHYTGILPSRSKTWEIYNL
jgi:uncharacterized protein with NRDE domain